MQTSYMQCLHAQNPCTIVEKFMTAGCLKNLSPTGFLWALLLDNIILLVVAGDGWDLQCGDE